MPWKCYFRKFLDCLYRCATYNNLPAGCTLQTDPADSCCQVPVCSPTPAPGITLAPLPGAPTPTAGPGLIPSLRPVIIGQGVTPSPKPGISTPHPLVPVCVYYGKKYGQGEKWRDGCQYICECIDANIGQYKCQERYVSCDMTKPTKWVCVQRRLKSGWASAQSDQSLRCSHEESLGP